MNARDRKQFRDRAKELVRLMSSSTRMIKFSVNRRPIKSKDSGEPYLQVDAHHVGHENNAGCTSHYYPTRKEIDLWWEMENREEYAVEQGRRLRWRNEIAREDRPQIVAALNAAFAK